MIHFDKRLLHFDMGNSDSVPVPMKPEEVQRMMEEVRDSNQELLEEMENIKQQEIFDLKTEMKKKDELQKETERTLNEVKWELEEVKEQNRQGETERESKINFLQKKIDELNDTHAKAQASLELVELRTNMDEITKDLLRKEVDELTEVNKKKLEKEKSLRKQLADLKLENLSLKAQYNAIKYKELSEIRFADFKSGN